MLCISWHLLTWLTVQFTACLWCIVERICGAQMVRGCIIMLDGLDNQSVTSSWIRSGPFPRRPCKEISDSQSVHIPPFQRWSSDLSGTASKYSLLLHDIGLSTDARLVRIQWNVVHADPPSPKLLVNYIGHWGATSRDPRSIFLGQCQR